MNIPEYIEECRVKYLTEFLNSNFQNKKHLQIALIKGKEIFDALQQCQDLTNLDIDCDAISSYEEDFNQVWLGLSKCQNLTTLSCSFYECWLESVSFFEGISNLPNLRTFNLSWCYYYVEQVQLFLFLILNKQEIKKAQIIFSQFYFFLQYIISLIIFKGLNYLFYFIQQKIIQQIIKFYTQTLNSKFNEQKDFFEGISKCKNVNHMDLNLQQIISIFFSCFNMKKNILLNIIYIFIKQVRLFL
ncbi:transmembrane protein, putative (macronuclear) [Tetrahymena thermophila SB210]|uniref:Transmembrane protein, putative n=1 Tax=Tetrahymena thermophila (strain SB210) TaxID=312017 RepID=W7X9X3_TETTS|nr:transmembrane protein, putative [Tetrahymena thermophila SB210]EWS74122.1 transmembrane protein, putative [Tetrahymena thermophila SB210]|eukprot:XP_012653343.1 transmembrane protein, putative [Tetrahymena thermophila SB210]